jgi:glycosyltransferase involved in cell wall biosynthesis
VDVAAALVQAGYQAIVASSGGPMVRELERAKVTHVTLPLDSKNPLVMRRNAVEIERLIAAHQVDIVHARSRAPAWSGYWAAKRTGTPFMTTFHAPYNISGRLKRLYNSVMVRGERIIAISEFIRAHIQENYGEFCSLTPAHIPVIPRGIDLIHFAPENVAPQRVMKLAESWRLPDGVPVIMLPGRLTRWKGQLVLLEAMAKLGRRDVCCVLVGSDQGRVGYHHELLERIDQLGLTGLVHIVDHCADMPAAYMLADAVVSASTEPEAFGRVIVEAQAMGRPVIVSNHGAVAETVVAGETAWTVIPGDADSLARALGEALALTAEQRAMLGLRERNHVAANFTRDRMCAATLAVYADLLAEHGKSRRDTAA